MRSDHNLRFNFYKNLSEQVAYEMSNELLVQAILTGLGFIIKYGISSGQ